MQSWGGAGRVGGRQRARLDASGPHVGQELVRDLSQHLLGQTGHAEDVVAPPVDVVSEGDELWEGGQGGFRGTFTPLHPNLANSSSLCCFLHQLSVPKHPNEDFSCRSASVAASTSASFFWFLIF